MELRSFHGFKPSFSTCFYILQILHQFLSCDARLFKRLTQQTLVENTPLPLVIDTFTTNLIRELQTDPAIPITGLQAELVKEKLRGLYASLKGNPFLNERRLKVASVKPQLPTTVSKRSHHSPAHPVCPSKTEWKLLHTANDINGSEVTVYQPQDGTGDKQWFYTVTCKSERPSTPDTYFDYAFETSHGDSACRGIRHNEFHSECIPKKSLVMAYVKKQGQTTYDWQYIEVNTSCNCALTPRA